MSLRSTYLVLCILGFALPYAAFVPWVAANGIDLPRFVAELFANRVSSFFALDVAVSAIVVIVLVLGEGRRRGVGHLWAPIAGTLLVGVSFGLPLYLWLRARPETPEERR